MTFNGLINWIIRLIDGINRVIDGVNLIINCIIRPITDWRASPGTGAWAGPPAINLPSYAITYPNKAISSQINELLNR